MDKKVALVTGSSQGLGKVIAKRLAGEGCFVVVNCHSNVERAQAVVDEIKAAGGDGAAYVCDISNPDAIVKMFAELNELYGGVDVLVNNARVDPMSRRPDESEAEWWDKNIAVKLRAPYLCGLEFFKYAEPKGWGRIINVSSARAHYPAEPSMVAYTVGNLGLHALTRSFALRGAPHGITANTLAPGMIGTENLYKRISPERYELEMSMIPLRRAGTCDEVADGVIFALRNGYVTGETININGGMTYAP